MKRFILVIIIGSTLIITGCASPYSKFYTDMTNGASDITKAKIAIITDIDPEIRRGSTNKENDERLMSEDNYEPIGYSEFNAGNVDTDGALSKGREVHAAVIIIYSQYTGTQSGYMPMTVPKTTTASTTTNGNIYGYGGSASYSGTSNTTYNGTNTTYIPYSVNKYDYVATYWIKLKPVMLGLLIKELPQEMHKKIGTNNGLLIWGVRKGSPAFNADIFSGDILVKLNDDVISDRGSFEKSVATNADKEVDILIVRDEKELHKLVKLRPIQK